MTNLMHNYTVIT